MKVNQYLKLIKEGYIGPHKNFTLQNPYFICISSKCSASCPAYREYRCNFADKHGVTVSHTAIPKLAEHLKYRHPEFFI